MCHIRAYFERLFFVASSCHYVHVVASAQQHFGQSCVPRLIISTRGIKRLHKLHSLACISIFFFFFLSESLFSFGMCECVDARESYNQVGITFTTFTHVTDVYTHPNLYLMSTAATPHTATARQSECSRRLVLGPRNAGFLCALFIITTHRQHLQHLSWGGERVRVFYTRGWRAKA